MILVECIAISAMSLYALTTTVVQSLYRAKSLTGPMGIQLIKSQILFLLRSLGIPFLKDVLNDLQQNSTQAFSCLDVCGLTGPDLLSRVYQENSQRYHHVMLEPRRVFHPFRMQGKNERQILLNNGTTIGVYHDSGSWRKRWTLTYLKEKLRKLLIN